MAYNQTALEATSNIWDLVVYADDATGNIFFTGMIIVVFFVMVMGLRRYGFENALLVSSFFSFMISAVLASVGVVSVYMALVFGILTALTYFYNVATGGG